MKRTIVLIEKNENSEGGVKELLRGKTGEVWAGEGCKLLVFFGTIPRFSPLSSGSDEVMFGVHGEASDCYPVLYSVGAEYAVGYYQSADGSIWTDVTTLCAPEELPMTSAGRTEPRRLEAFESLWKRLAGRNQQRIQVALWQDIGYPLSQIIVALDLKRFVEPDAARPGSQDSELKEDRFRQSVEALLERLRRGPAHESGRFKDELGCILKLIEAGRTPPEELIRDLRTIVSASLRGSEGLQGIVVIAGGSSPRTEKQAPVYYLLEREARKRGRAFALLDFAGQGHAPEVGDGLLVSVNISQARQRLKELTFGGTLFCRCYGCVVGAVLLADYPDELKRFRRVVFWAPMSKQAMSELCFGEGGKIENYNSEYALERGYSYHSAFFDDLPEMEGLVSRFPRDKEYHFACGDLDTLCSQTDIDKLVEVLYRETGIVAAKSIVERTRHSVSDEDEASVIEKYLEIAFG